MTIQGSGFTPSTWVFFGETPASNVTYLSPQSLMVTSPPKSGLTDVTARRAGGTSTTSAADQYYFGTSPAITKLSVSHGPTTGGTTVTITGSGFSNTSGILFGSVSAASYTVLSDTQLRVTSPPNTAGVSNVSVTNPVGASADTAADGYLYVDDGGVTSVGPARLLSTVSKVGASGPVAAHTAIGLSVLGKGGVPSSGVAAVVLNVTVSGSQQAGSVTVYRDGTSRPATPNVMFSAIRRSRIWLSCLWVRMARSTSITARPAPCSSPPTYKAGSPPGRRQQVVLRRSVGAVVEHGVEGGCERAGRCAHGDWFVGAREGWGAIFGCRGSCVERDGVRFAAGGFGDRVSRRHVSPATPNVMFSANQTIADLVVVPVGTNGKVDFYNGAAGTVQLSADVQGWIAAGTPAAGGVAALRSARLLSTVSKVGASGPVAAHTAIGLSVLGKGGVPSSGVAAVVLNVTVSGSQQAGSVTVYRDGTSRPATPNVMFSANQTIADLVVVPVGTNGKVDFYNGAAGTVQLSADVQGWIAT